MSAKKLIAVVVALTLVVIGVFYYNSTNTYAYHLNKARIALEQLERVLQGRQSTALVPAAHAEDEEVKIDEELVKELTRKVIKKTEAAIEAVRKIDDAGKISQALEEVSEVQEKIIDILFVAAEIVEGETTVETIAATLMLTDEQQEAVEVALRKAAQAVADGKKKIEIEIEIARNRLDQTSGRAELDAREAALIAQAAVDTLQVLIDSGDANEEVIAQLEAKMDKILIALEEKKLGRVKGLSTALQTKIRNINRKVEREREMERIRTQRRADEERS